MKALSTVVLVLSLFAMSGCHHFGHHCPPGQAKKGNCL